MRGSAIKGTGSFPLWVHVALVAVFTLSGASALAYQVLWTRQLSFVLGGSAIAVSTVLAVFFAGLGLGSLLGGRLADRVRNPLLLYGFAELIILGAALATPFLLSTSGSIYLGLHRVLGGSPVLALLGRVVATAIILIVPTTMMGATLPLVSRFYIRRIDHLGRGLGLLYGVNTLGGMIGAAFVGYYAVLTFGVRHSFYLAVGANLVAALVAIVISKLLPPAPQGGTEDPGMQAADLRLEPVTLRLALLGLFVSGFTSIAYEVLWTRALNFAIGNSVYAFTTILVVFLGGLVPGAFLAGRLADLSKNHFRSLAVIQILTGLVALATFTQAPKLPGLAVRLSEKIGAGTMFSDIFTKVVPAAIALVPPAILIGLTFPFILKVVTDRIGTLGRRVGSFYAVNTVGGILGSITAGFLLLPTIGLTKGMILVAAINAVMGGLFLTRSEGRLGRRLALPLGVAVVAAAGIAIATLQPVPFIRHTSMARGHDVVTLFHKEGHTASVSVTEESDPRRTERTLWINLLGASITDSKYYHQQYYTLVSLFPVALHPAPRKVFVAGLASGVTAGAAALDDRTAEMTCVEISPEVIDAVDLFAEYNFRVGSDPKARIIADDARAYLETTEDRYDVIITDVFISAVTGTSALYSREYFQLCRRRLAPDGIMSVGVGNMVATDATVARTFVEAFPYVAAFVLPHRAAYNRTFLIGANEPLHFSHDSIRAAFAQSRVAAEWNRYGVHSPEELSATYLCGREELLEHLQNAEICTDDRPIIDFLAVAWAEGFVATGRSRGTPGIERLRKTLKPTTPSPFAS